jgi:hypothetical protein
LTIFLALITAHFVSDFMLQSGFREKRSLPGALRHIVVTGCVVALSLRALVHWEITGEQPPAVIALWAAAAAVLHTGQDLVFGWCQSKRNRRFSNLHLFWADQGLHLLVLWGLAQLYSRQAALVPSAGATVPRVEIAHAVLWAVLLVALGSGLAAVLIAHLLEPFRHQMSPHDADSKLANAGLWIGLCERFILALGIATGSDVFPAVGLALTAKSIFRFRELDKRENAEYYLLGSLASIAVAVVVGLSLRTLLPEVLTYAGNKWILS